MISPQPTKRFVLEPSLVCNIKCKFCYHLHRFNTWKDTVKSLDEMKARIDEGVKRGNNYMDITGGEPTIYPHINELIEYALSKGVRSCIITNGIVSPEKSHSLLCSGLDGFLVSRHGLENTHNYITNRKDAYKKQEEFLCDLKLSSVNPNLELRFNCVISKFNQYELLEIAMELAEHEPSIINFINMNPHHEWMEKSLETQDVIADLNIVKPILNLAIEYLESEGIGVNVRYYPMCKVADHYRRVVCNDFQVMCDPYEWDYHIGTNNPKTLKSHIQWGIDCSSNNEEKGEPCNTCTIHNICGGANKHFHKASNQIYGEVLEPTEYKIPESADFYYYRQFNNMTLKER
jgi:MoaA/NifB/PqqE/SkfB family radical SAM enzyme